MIKLKSDEECCGCEACKQICPNKCISIITDKQGFAYPNIETDNCVNCGLCTSVCPIINQAIPQKPINAYAAYTKNDNIRKESSSGGIYSIIAEHILSKSGIVYGAAFDNNWQVIHCSASTLKEYTKFRGSKYVQSQIGNTFCEVKADLQQGRNVLYTGTPCQISALKNFLNIDYPNLITIDIICHGVSSPLVWKEYLYSKIKNPDYINFRDKEKYGWKNYALSIQGKRDIGYYKDHSYDDYMNCYIGNLFLRPSCYNCPAKKFRSQSDITLGDYWGLSQIHRELDDDKGTNLIIVNTPKGNNLVHEAVRGDNAHIIITDLEYAISNNPSISQSATKSKYTDNFWIDFHKQKSTAIKKYGKKFKPTLMTQLKIFIYNFIHK